MDEAQLVTQTSLDVILPTIRTAGSQCVWSWNPGQDPSAIDLMFRGDNLPERSRVVSVMFFDNPYFYRSKLPGRQRSDFKAKGLPRYRHIWLGTHLTITDATVFEDLFTDEDLDIHILEQFGEPIAGMDFSNGGTDPHAVVRGYKLPPDVCQMYSALKHLDKPIIYVAGECVESGKLPQNRLHEVTTEAGVFAQPVNCDSANPAAIDALVESGVNAYPTDKGRVKHGIEILRSHVIIVSPRCPITADELQKLRYATDRITGKVLVGENTKFEGVRHCVDALRYSILPTSDSKRSKTSLKVFHNGKRIS